MISELKDEQSTSVSCKICCNSQGNRIHAAKEMMLGLRTEFHYVECADCGSVWLVDPPSDLSIYYPQNYYSFAKPMRRSGFKNAFVSHLRVKRDLSYFGEGGWVGRYLARRYEHAALRATLRLKIDRNSRILDVGCGSGQLLLRLHDLGFKNLTGIDPFISHDIDYGNGVWIRKGSLDDVKDENWDALLFHHSLEHVPNPIPALRIIGDLLDAGGQCLIRVPVVSWAWEHYTTSWRGLDPPRHFWLPTQRGMGILAESAGLTLVNVEYDSDADQFWLSEAYLRGHAYVEIGSSESNLERFFTRKQLSEFRAKARTLNEQGCGDTAAFFLEKLA